MTTRPPPASRLLVLSLSLLGLALLFGCSASMIKITPSDPGEGTATAVVTLVQEGTGDAVTVGAVVIVGGERAEVPAGENTVRVPNIPIPAVQAPAQPTQPLTATAPGFVTVLQQLQLNVVGDTVATVELTAADPDTTGTVSGRVTSAENGNPIRNVVLRFRPDIPDTTVIVEGATDTNGEYTIGGIPTGNVNAQASADGYLLAASTVLVVQDSSPAGNPDLDFELVPTSSKATVRGRVMDLINRDSIPDAIVTVGALPSVTTRSDGSFEVTEVPVGPQLVTVTASGYDDATVTLTITPDMPVLVIELAPSEAGPPPGPSTISGAITVRNRPDYDNSGVTVRLVDVTTEQVLDTVVTGFSGDYGFFVPPGRYRIEVSLAGSTISKVVNLGGAGRVLTGVDFQITPP